MLADVPILGIECDVRRSLPYLLLLSLVSFAGCQSPPNCCPTDIVRPDVLQRVSFESDVSSAGMFEHDEQKIESLAKNALGEDALVMLALENNKLFQATLTQLGMVQGDWIQASLLTNPNLVNYLPLSVKQWEWTLYLPIEAFLLRPHREAISHSDYHRVANELVQNGLTLVRDVRTAHADFALATEQLRLAEEALQIREEIDALTKKRLEGGDIGELEARQAHIDVMTAQANLALLRQDVDVARNRLHTLIGIPYNEQPIDSILVPPLIASLPNESALVERALASRPDMRAAAWSVNAASRRSRLARWLFLRIDGAVDANQKGDKGYEVGPGIRFDVPIFNRNQGGRMRANAEWCQAISNRDAVHDRIVEEVRTAVAQLQQTRRGLTILESQVVPSLTEAIQIARRGYEDGGAGYLLVLQTTTQYLETRARVLDQTAALRRAHAELERSIAGPLLAVDNVTISDDNAMN